MVAIKHHILYNVETRKEACSVRERPSGGASECSAAWISKIVASRTFTLPGICCASGEVTQDGTLHAKMNAPPAFESFLLYDGEKK